MMLDKPEWVVHPERLSSINSVSIDYKGHRVATAGGERVVVWSLGPILHAAREVAEDVHKTLATLRDHTEVVHTVRFASRSLQLASGSEDGTCLVYELRPGPGPKTFGTKETASVENWRVKLTLRTKTRGGDERLTAGVPAVAWSADDALVALGSFDNTVLLFDAKTGASVATLGSPSPEPGVPVDVDAAERRTGHSGHVRGLAFDPVGKYLATQGAVDGSEQGVIVWNAETWTEEARVVSVFQDACGVTYYQRLAWSTDGSRLCVVGALSQGKPVVALLFRRGLDTDDPKYQPWGLDFTVAGHRHSTTAVACGPRLTVRKDGGGEGIPGFLTAVASMDLKVSVWHTSLPRPVVVLKNAFKQAVVDLAWTPDGRTLVACSTDNSIAVMRFDDAEIGVPMSDKEMEIHMRETYGARQGTAQAPVLEALAAGVGTAGNGAANGMPGSGTPRPAQGAAAKRIAPVSVGSGGVAGSAGVGLDARLGRGRDAFGTPRLPQSDNRVLTARAVNVGPQPGPGSGAAGAARVPDSAAPASANPGAAPGGLLPLPKAVNPLVVPMDKPKAVDQSAAPAAPAVHGTELPGSPAPQPSDCYVELVSGRGARGECCSVKLLQGGEAAWQDIVQGTGVAGAATRRFTAVGTSDGVLHVFTPCGRRALPRVQLGLPAAYLATDGDWRLAVLGADGWLTVWDMAARKSTLRASVAALVTPPRSPGDFAGIALDRDGRPRAVVGSEVFMFDPGMGVWMCLADRNFPLSSFAVAALASGDEAGMARIAELDPVPARHNTRAHLESLMSTAALIGDGKAYAQWLRTYVTLLASHQELKRLQELLEDLLGPSPAEAGRLDVEMADDDDAGPLTTGAERNGVLGKRAGREDWQSGVGGIDKAWMLKQVALPAAMSSPSFASDRALVRLVTDMTEAMEERGL